MKKILFLLLSTLALSAGQAQARDDIGDYAIAPAMSSEDAKEKLGTDVAFYFGDQPHGTVVKSFVNVKTNKKTSSVFKSDEEACNWVFLSAMIALKNTAIEQGGNAVINIQSNYKDNLTSSSETFQCGAGAMLAGVALKGTVVLLAPDGPKAVESK